MEPPLAGGIGPDVVGTTLRRALEETRLSRFCQKTQTLAIDAVSPSAAERQNVIIRRIDKNEYVQRVPWRYVSGEK